MKYQIIVESSEVLSDDEFTQIATAHLSDGYFTQYGFKLLYAQSLEGIRKELYAKRDELRDNIGLERTVTIDDKIDETFESLSDLFKL